MKISSEDEGLDLKMLGGGASKEFLKLVLVDLCLYIQLSQRLDQSYRTKKRNYQVNVKSPP